jgi:hypothetical protein
MKRLGILFSFLVFVSAVSFSQGTITIKPDVGIDDVVLHETTFNDVVKKYGGKYKIKEEKWTEHFVSSGYTVFKSRTLHYKKLGLSFTFVRKEFGDEKLTRIDIYKPAVAKTPEGIVLNESTITDADLKYKKGKWSYSVKQKHVLKTYDGIKFMVKMKKKIRFYDKQYLDENYLDKPIIYISVFKDYVQKKEEE